MHAAPVVHSKKINSLVCVLMLRALSPEFLTTMLFCFAAGVEGKGVTATKEYTGCMRNLVSKNPGGSAQPVSLVNPLMMAGNVYLGGCPYYTS